MKILIIANSLGGLIGFRTELINRLQEEGHLISVIVPKDNSDVSVLGNVDFHFVPMERRGTNPLKDIKLYFQYRKIIKEIKPNVLFTYTIKCNIYGGIAARMLNIPYIANITGLGTALEYGGVLQVITKFMYKFAMKKVKTIFFQNQDNMLFFKKNRIQDKKKYLLLPGSGVNLKKFCLVDYPQDEVVKFVFISRIMKEKGIEQYLDAAKYIKEHFSNTEFHICGYCEQNYNAILKEYAEKKIIIYHGIVQDIRTILKDMHCTIHPSYYPEGMSNVLLESCAMGKPIITTNRSGCKEIVDNGLNGFICEMKNSSDLINKIKSFLNLSYDDKKKMGINGRKKVELEFDREIVVNKYLDVIETIK